MQSKDSSYVATASGPLARVFRRLLARLSKKPSAQHTLNLPNFPHSVSMEVHETTDIHISEVIAGTGIWEPDETRFIIDVLTRGDIFVDVGANIGYFTIIGSKMVGPEGKVYSFEPDKENYSLLTANCQTNQCDNVRRFQVALSNETREGLLYLNATNKGDHTIYPSSTERSSVEISLVNGSEVFSRSHEKINFLKIDTQGSEYQVIDGLSAIIRVSLPDLVMIVEFSPNSMKMAGYCGEAFLELFASFEGYFYIFDDHHRGLIPISRQHLTQWANLTEMDPSSEGFINLLFSGRSLENRTSFNIVYDLGLFDHALDYLFGDRLPPWNGKKCSGTDMLNHIHFSSGWSFPEEWGVWSIGKNSTLKFFFGEKLNSCESPTLRFTGRYFGEDEQTLVEINDLAVGRYNLRDVSIALPEHCLNGAHMTIRLTHHRPLRPADFAGSGDNREIKFGIESIGIGPSGKIPML